MLPLRPHFPPLHGVGEGHENPRHEDEQEPVTPPPPPPAASAKALSDPCIAPDRSPRNTRSIKQSSDRRLIFAFCPGVLLLHYVALCTFTF
ncbi:hypothetical protein BD410DRAFT_796080, partial [Rickenella mellea]